MSKYKIKRKVLDDLKDHLNKKEISLITGPRQSGKTTLMEELERSSSQEGRKSIWFNLDFESDKTLFKNQTKLLKEISIKLGESGGLIFIDEIQRKENAGLFLKGIYDHAQHEGFDYKFIVSGSGSLELKEKIQESLAGRKRVFELPTVSFKEFVNFKTDYEYEDNLFDFYKLRNDLYSSLLEEYLNFGGYPEVILADSQKEKQKNIQEIFQSYIDKDIAHILGLERIDAFNKMLNLLAINPGKLINYDKLASSSDISLPTLKKYLWYAKKTFILRELSPYFKNKKKEIVKSPKMYFFDVGLISFIAGNFGNVTSWPSSSFIFENIILNMLKEKLAWTNNKIRFWRTKGGSEVDFVVSSKADTEIIPVEVKFSDIKKPKIGKSLHSFIEKYDPDRTFIVNKSLDKEIKIKNTKIKFITLAKFIQTDI